MKNSLRTIKALIANAMVAVMIMLSVIVAPTSTVSAAAKPALTKKSISIQEGKKYDLNVKNKIKGSTYAWSSSNKKVAKVTKKGVVTGVKKGTATIKCKITNKKNTYNLSCKVTVIKPANGIQISNKIDTLTLGQTYDLNRKLSPTSSNEKTTWTSSDTSVATVDKNGVVTALKLGEVTITAKCTSGHTDSVKITIVDKEAVASNQTELEELLKSGAADIKIQTEASVSLNIPAGDYSNTKLVVDAPKADITNYGKFASIEIRNIKADTWHEEAVGNLLTILAAKSRVVVGTNAKVSIEVSEQGATMTIVNNGVVEKITIEKPANVDVSGASKTSVPVVVNVPGIKISTSVPLALECNAKAEVVLKAGAESSTIQAATKEAIPEIKGNVTVNVKVGTGANATTETVVGTPITDTPAQGGPGGGSSSGGSGGGTTTPDYQRVDNGLTTTYQLKKPISELSSIVVTYGPASWTMDSDIISKLVGFLTNETKTVQTWKDTTNTERTYTSSGLSQKVTVTGDKDSATKTVTFETAFATNLQFDVTVDAANRKVTVTGKNPGSVTYTFTAGEDLKSLSLTKSAATASTPDFTPVFK